MSAIEFIFSSILLLIFLSVKSLISCTTSYRLNFTGTKEKCFIVLF